MTHDRPYLETATMRELHILLQYVTERREEAEDSLQHTMRRFRAWQERNDEPKLPPAIHKLAELDQITGYEQMQDFISEVDLVSLVGEIISYTTLMGLYTGVWTSHQGDADHYGGQTDVLRCMESELMYHLNSKPRG